MRYVTGQACCGKTTALKVLEESGWRVYSRKDIGTFSGKSKSAFHFAVLHAAQEDVLRREGTIGDRGPIDNPFWVLIMHQCNPIYKNSALFEPLSYLNNHLTNAL
jgi:hypothetical protein